MSYEKDKELMQEVHDLIEDYNYLKKVIPIIKKSYIEERKKFYIQTYQYYADILSYQIKLINKFLNIELEIKDILNIDNIKKKIEDMLDFDNFSFLNEYYFSFNEKFKECLLEIDNEIKKNIEKANNVDIGKMKIFLFKITTQFISDIDKKLLDLYLLQKPEEIIEIEKINLENQNDELKSIMIKIKYLNSIDFHDFVFNEKFLSFYKYEYFNEIKNELYNNNIIEDYKFKKEEIINLIGLNITKKYNTYSIHKFLTSDWDGVNENLENLKKYIDKIFYKNFDKLLINENRKTIDILLFENDYLFLFFFEDFENLNFNVLLCILKYLSSENLLKFYNQLPQKYKDLFTEKLVSTFDKENEVNIFRKLQLNNKLNKNIIEKPSVFGRGLLYEQQHNL